MKCIDNELIQRYIDGETDFQETARIKKHLTDCPQCASNVEEQKTFVEAIKREIDKMGKQTVTIPEFVAPSVHKYRFNIKFRHYIYAASAACAIFLIVFLNREQSVEPRNNTEIQLIYSFDGDFDSNRTVSQQEMTIIMIDANGKIIEYN